MTDFIERSRTLHGGPGILVLPNAWEVGSARLVEHLGAKAVATTSAGVAWSHGYPDGDALPASIYLRTLERIVASVQVPVTADVEGGYSDDPEQVASTVSRFISAGIAGINIEDGSNAPELLAEKVSAIRAAVGPGLFINARTDVFPRGLAPGAEIETVLTRARLYRAAGCDGIFVPGVTDAGAIAALVAGLDAPLNVMARPALPAAPALAALGVRRLSAGSAIAQAATGLAARLTTHFLAGRSDALFSGAMTYADINALIVNRSAAAAS